MTRVIVVTEAELRALIRETLVEVLQQQPASAPQGPAAYVTTKEAAALLGVSAKHLEAMRARGGGPPYLRIGHAIRYKTSDLQGPHAPSIDRNKVKA